MAEPHFIEDDDHEKARAWWTANRVPIISGVVIGLAIILGTNAWKSYQKERADAASSLYSQMLDRDQVGDGDSASEAGQTLINEYKDTAYAGKAALILARISYDAKQAAAATERLLWVIDNVSQFEIYRRWQGEDWELLHEADADADSFVSIGRGERHRVFGLERGVKGFEDIFRKLERHTALRADRGEKLLKFFTSFF